MAIAKEEQTFEARLMAAIASMPNPVKDTKAYQYSYETLPQVLGIIQPALVEHGIYVMQGLTVDGTTTYLQTILHDSQSTYERLADVRPVHLVGDSRKDGSAETYARRYALKTVFGLAGEDDDGEAASEPAKPAPKPTPKPAQPQAQKSAKPANRTEQKPTPCTEYQGVMQALRRFTEVCGEPETKVWDDFKKKYGDVNPADQELCAAILEDLNAAIRRIGNKKNPTPTTKKEN